jgi:hypothetical protein
MSAFDNVVSCFRELGIELNSDWLAGLELLNGRPLTNDDVYLSLVSSDLRHSCLTLPSSRLTPEALRGRNCLPEGSFLFQITSAVDISIPDAQRPRTNNSSQKRMLKYRLNCGNIEMHAVELEIIPSISDLPEAGMKIIIGGSPKLCRGLLLLTPGNVCLVGGDVDHLVSIQKKDMEQRMRIRDPLVNNLSEALTRIESG